MKDKMFRTLSVKGWWTDEGYADIELWIRECDTVQITKERIPFRQFMDMPYLYQEVKLKDIQLYKDEQRGNGYEETRELPVCISN